MSFIKNETLAGIRNGSLSTSWYTRTGQQSEQTADEPSKILPNPANIQYELNLRQFSSQLETYLIFIKLDMKMS